MKHATRTLQASTVFLRLVVLSFAAFILGLCIFALPAGIMSDNTNMYRWILLGLYVPAIPFFYAIQQTMQLLKYIDNDTAFSPASVNVLKNVKRCAAFVAGLFT